MADIIIAFLEKRGQRPNIIQPVRGGSRVHSGSAGLAVAAFVRLGLPAGRVSLAHHFSDSSVGDITHS